MLVLLTLLVVSEGKQIVFSLTWQWHYYLYDYLSMSEIKLVDVAEMNYTSQDQPHPRGEICIRGPIVFQGYYKDEVQTYTSFFFPYIYSSEFDVQKLEVHILCYRKEVIDGDGWLHTGDIGLWLPGGRLKIIDRYMNRFQCLLLKGLAKRYY